MKKQMDKLKSKVKMDKKLLLFFVVLLLVGVIVGSIFVTILNSSDKTLISEYLNNFLDNIQNGTIDYWLVLKNNFWNILLFVAVVWLLGISVIGLPVIVIMFFVKSFLLGFTVGGILFTFKLKGALFALVYIFPGQIFSLLACLVLSMYAISFSLRLIHALFKKQALDFKHMMNRYLLILGLVISVIILTTLYDTYIMPIIVKSMLSIIR